MKLQKSISESGVDAAAEARWHWMLREWRRLGLWLPVLLGIGIAWFFGLDAPTKASAWLMAAGCFYFAAFICWYGMRQLHYRGAFIAFWLIGLAMGTIALGGGVAALRMPEIATPILKREVEQTTLSGVVKDILVEPEAIKIVLGELRIDALGAHEKPKLIRLTSKRYRMEAEAIPGSKAEKKLKVEFDVGDRVILRATLFPPPPPASPGQFDFARHFYFKQVGAVGITMDKINILKKATEVDGFDGWLARFRLHLSESIRQQIGSHDGRWAEGAIATALMSGQQTAIPESVNEAMRISGLSHVLSISGLHLALAAGIVFVSLRLMLLVLLPARLRDKGAKKIAALLALIAAGAYLAVAGYPIAAQRSYVMVGIVLLAVMLDRQAMGMRSLAIAAMLLLLWQPEALLSSSFKLSFAATLAIVAWAEAGAGVVMWWKSNESLPPWLRTIGLYLFGAVFTSFVASMITAPLIMADFQQFNSYGVLANLLLSPLVSFWIMPLVVISFLAMPFGVEALPLQGLGWGICKMIALAEWVSALPYASITTPTVPPLGIGLVVAGGLWLMLWRTGWLRSFGLIGITAGVLLAYTQPAAELLIGRNGKQVASVQENGSWRMMVGSHRNLNAQMWLEAVGQQAYAQPEKVNGRSNDALCNDVRCVWNIGGRTVMLRFDAKALKAYKPRAPKKPDSELTEAQLKKRLQAREKSAAKRAEKNAGILAERNSWQREADKQAASLGPNDLLIDVRTETVAVKTAARVMLLPEILAAGGMKLWFADGAWQLARVADQQGHWPWAMTQTAIADRIEADQ